MQYYFSFLVENNIDVYGEKCSEDQWKCSLWLFPHGRFRSNLIFTNFLYFPKFPQMKIFNNEKNHCFQKHIDRNSKKWIGICAKCSSWVDSDHKNKRSSEEESWGHTYLCFSWISHVSSRTSQAVLFLMLCIVFTALPLYSKSSFCPALLPHILSLVPSKLKGLAENTSSYITNALSLTLLLLLHFTSYYGCWCPPTQPQSSWRAGTKCNTL